MSSPVSDASANAFLIVAPAGRDALVIGDLLTSAGLKFEVDPDGDNLLTAIRSGQTAGAIVTDDAWARIGVERLREAVESQPPWSDFPFILLSRRDAAREGTKSLDNLVNATVLERPLHPATLISAARSLLRGRQRQRMAAQHLADREQARAELRELADTLEAKVDERTADLATANDRLMTEIAEREKAEARLIQAQKMEAVGQLTGGLAHDFNNLLTAVIGSLDLLLRYTDDERIERLARIALQAAERGAKLTGQLLAFSRQQRLSPSALNLNEVLTNMGDLLARTIGSHIRVETKLDPTLWDALTDRTQFEVVLLNLALNARDAMPAGGRLTIETQNLSAVPKTLEAELKPGEYVAITVSDTGSGMAPEVIARAFEPFFTTKPQGKGTGLGLSQLYGFAHQSGGAARIESVEGRGTTVTVYLPRTHKKPDVASAPIGETRPPQRARVLLVDDDDNVRAIAAVMLEEIGYDVTMAGSATAALELLGAGQFDLLLTDVVMPTMTGVELARLAKDLAPQMPVAFASGYADLEVFGAELDDEVVLKKPFRLAELAARLSEILSQRSSDNVITLRKA